MTQYGARTGPLSRTEEENSNWIMFRGTSLAPTSPSALVRTVPFFSSQDSSVMSLARSTLSRPSSSETILVMRGPRLV